MNIDRKIIEPNDGFPNNPTLPILLYRKIFKDPSSNIIRSHFEANGWHNCWVNGIFPFHHFHSNTHEVLGVAKGFCNVQLGGEGAPVFKIEAGDCLVIPAGVAHKNVASSDDFVCVGGYPTSLLYDMHEETTKELSKIAQQIKQVPMPKSDPVFGDHGPIFDEWIHG